MTDWPDTQTVLDTLAPRAVEVQTKGSKWYTMRIRPYRTLDNVIDGALIAFVDITEMKRMREALRKIKAQDRIAAAVADAHNAIIVQDLEGRIRHGTGAPGRRPSPIEAGQQRR
jgi:two-component system, chemotaxis family, CheB/CheR fusion protein